MLGDLTKQRFGAHLSVAGGLENALSAAVAVGCDCLQIFVKNQRQWSAGPLTGTQIATFRAAWAASGVDPVVAHAGYLPNLASPDAELRRRSIAAIADELERCEALGVPALVTHPGAHRGAGVAAGVRRVVSSINAIHQRTPGFATRLLLETTAGQGTALGSVFPELLAIISGVREPERVMVCLDTCHLFAAGYDLSDPAGYQRTIAELTASIGLDRVKCLHVNDSQQPCGSHRDRHEHIGKGAMGRRAFIHLVNDRRLAEVPKILETPKGVDGRGTDLDRVNLRRLRGMIGRFGTLPKHSVVRHERTP